MNNPERVTPSEAAEYLHITTGSLSNMRSQGRGPEYYKLGGIYYKKADLDIYVESQKVRPSNNG